MSGVKHNVWPTAWQILAEALDPDHTHAGSENNSMRTHPHKHTDYTHAHVTVWEEHFCLCLTLSYSYRKALSFLPSFLPSLSPIQLYFFMHICKTKSFADLRILEGTFVLIKMRTLHSNLKN